VINAFPSLVGLLLVTIALGPSPLRAEDSLPALTNGDSPHNYGELWAGYDPCREPMDIEVLKQWEEDGVVLRVIRYRIGVFKGQKAIMAGVYGFPKGAAKLPGLLQIHGGGQYADYKAPLTNAKRGYATLSIAWAGRISAPGYTVNPDVVKLFWEGKTNDPLYKLTTDWGSLDAYHAPCRNQGNAFASVSPAAWTLDAVESPRNNPWFLCTLGARRGLTFLQQQPEVDGERLGVYGHSMGGKLTVMAAAADGGNSQSEAVLGASECLQPSRTPDQSLSAIVSGRPRRLPATGRRPCRSTGSRPCRSALLADRGGLRVRPDSLLRT
jgi:hypothetical protein